MRENSVLRRLSPKKKVTTKLTRPAPLPEPYVAPKVNSTTCHKCGMEFETGKAYGYSCSNTGCPVQPTVVA